MATSTATPTIAELAQTLLAGFKNGPDAIKKPIYQSQTDIVASFDKSKAPQIGDTLPPFTLEDATSHTASLGSLLSSAEKGLLITFYRGHWCPFCNIELHGLQQHLAAFDAAGVKLVAITPELPDQSLTTVEKHNLKFSVLTDKGNSYARELGIVWDMPDYLREPFGMMGHDLNKWNGDDSFSVPVPTHILVDKEGKVRNTFIEPDYVQRLEPAVAVEWAQAL